MRAHLLSSMIKEVQEVVEVAGHVVDAHRLGVQAQLLPGHHLQQLLQRAKAPGDTYKGVRLCRHLGLPQESTQISACYLILFIIEEALQVYWAAQLGSCGWLCGVACLYDHSRVACQVFRLVSFRLQA